MRPNVIKVKSLKDLQKECLSFYRCVPKFGLPENMSHLFCKVVLNQEKRLYVSFDITPSTGEIIQFYSNLRFGPLSSYLLLDETDRVTVSLPSFFRDVAKEIIFPDYEKRIYSRFYSSLRRSGTVA